MSAQHIHIFGVDSRVIRGISKAEALREAAEAAAFRAKLNGEPCEGESKPIPALTFAKEHYPALS